MISQSHCHTPVAALSIGRLVADTGQLTQGLVKNPFQLVDLQARRVAYLRISVTDRCNYRCTYCMPEAGVHVVARDELLHFDEIERLGRVFAELGVTRIRLTGGEPLLRKNIESLVASLAQIPGINDLAMTTNGHLLADMAGLLHQAGLQRLNVSIDTLDPHRFSEVTRRGDLASVLRGLEVAQNQGFAPIKLNAVVLRGLNDHELPQLCEFAAKNGHILRLIEYMPIGVDAFWSPSTFVAVAEMRKTLEIDWDLTPDDAHGLPGGGPAKYWRGVRRSDGLSLRLGLISAVTENFCRLCNRVRLSSTGTLRECLSTAGALSLRDMMRQGRNNNELREAIAAALAGKVEGHRFHDAVPTVESMSSIGG